MTYGFWQKDNIEVAADLTVIPTFAGKIKVITSETYSNGVDSELDLGAKTGYRLSFPANMLVSPKLRLGVSPWFEHSEIGQSQVVPNATLSPHAGSGIMEPSSKTDQFGVETVLSYEL